MFLRFCELVAGDSTDTMRRLKYYQKEMKTVHNCMGENVCRPDGFQDGEDDVSTSSYQSTKDFSGCQILKQ